MIINNMKSGGAIRPWHYIVASVLAATIASIGAINLIHNGTIPMWGHKASVAFVSIDGSIAIMAALAALSIKKSNPPIAQINEALPSEIALSAEELSNLRIPLMLHVGGKKVDPELAKLIEEDAFFNTLKGLDKEAACQWISNNCSFTQEKKEKTLAQFKELLEICKKQGQSYTGRFKELIQFASLDPQLIPAFRTALDKNYLAVPVLLYLLR